MHLVGFYYKNIYIYIYIYMNRKHIHIYSAYQNLVQKFSLFMTPFWHILHFKILCNNAGSEVLTVLLLKIQGFWHVTLCHWVSSSRCFEDNIVFITGVMQSFKCKNEGTMILQNAGKCSSSNIISQPTKHHESSNFVNNITTPPPPNILNHVDLGATKPNSYRAAVWSHLDQHLAMLFQPLHCCYKMCILYIQIFHKDVCSC